MKRILVSIFIFSSFFLFSQENDFQTWNSLSINKKLSKKSDLIYKFGLRFRENSSILSKQFYEVKYKYSILKRVAFSTGFRYSDNWDKKRIINRSNRFFLDVLYKDKLYKRLSFSLRNRLQSQGFYYDYNLLFRQKFSLNYNIRKTKFDPSISTEYFYNLDEGINKLRSGISFTNKITKNLDFDFGYKIQNEFGLTKANTFYILECKISYDL